jgi:hypothetical protein
MVSLKELKEDAKKILETNPDSVVLRMILEEPDTMPLSVARVKMEMYARQLYLERHRT